MFHWWKKFEYIVEKSRLRAMFNILELIALIALFVKRNLYTALCFLGILGFFAVFAGITPSFLRSSKELLAKYIPPIVATVLFIVIRIWFVVVGLGLIILMVVGLYSYAKTGIL